MRKLGVVLAFVVLFATLSVSTTQVSAVGNDYTDLKLNLEAVLDVTNPDLVGYANTLAAAGYTIQQNTSSVVEASDSNGVHFFIYYINNTAIKLKFVNLAITDIFTYTTTDGAPAYNDLISQVVTDAGMSLNSVVSRKYTTEDTRITQKTKVLAVKVRARSTTALTFSINQNIPFIWWSWKGYYYHYGDSAIPHLNWTDAVGNNYDEVKDKTWLGYYGKPIKVYFDNPHGYPRDGTFEIVLFTTNENDAYQIVTVNSKVEVQPFYLEPPSAMVTFNIVDALTGQSLTGVTVKEGSNVLGTVDERQILEIPKGTHTLTFEKTGYWSVTKTIDVQSDMSVSVEMYPSSAAFKLENFPSDLTIPENTLYTLTFTLSPIDTSATYNTYLSISGLSDIIEVRKDGSLVSPENGKYYLGDISSPIQVSIKFKAGAVGTHGFTLTLTSNDAIMSQTYTTTKQVTYQVEPLPFSVQMPSEWQVGTNELRISESSGQSYLITAVLKDSSGNEVWSDSYAFSPYEAHTFSINVPSEGSYTLELQFNGQTAVYDVQVNPAITLVTKTLTVSEGAEGVITLHFKNPSSSVQYYTIKVSGGFLPAEINQSISVAPLTEKDVSITFAVPEDLTYDAYELNVQVLQGDSVVFSDKVAVTISDSGFTLFGGGSNTSTWAYALFGLLVLGGLVFVLRRR